MKKIKLENCENIGEFLNNLDWIFKDLKGNTKQEVIFNFLDDIKLKIKNNANGYIYHWSIAPGLIKYYEDENNWFEIDFILDEIIWNTPDIEVELNTIVLRELNKTDYTYNSIGGKDIKQLIHNIILIFDDNKNYSDYNIQRPEYDKDYKELSNRVFSSICHILRNK